MPTTKKKNKVGQGDQQNYKVGQNDVLAEWLSYWVHGIICPWCLGSSPAMTQQNICHIISWLEKVSTWGCNQGGTKSTGGIMRWLLLLASWLLEVMRWWTPWDGLQQRDKIGQDDQ